MACLSFLPFLLYVGKLKELNVINIKYAIIIILSIVVILIVYDFQRLHYEVLNRFILYTSWYAQISSDIVNLIDSRSNPTCKCSTTLCYYVILIDHRMFSIKIMKLMIMMNFSNILISKFTKIFLCFEP